MKAKKLEQDDVVLFPNGSCGTVKSVNHMSVVTQHEHVMVLVSYGTFDTIYNPNDELLVARKGQIL
jgi:hypothetical protein